MVNICPQLISVNRPALLYAFPQVDEKALCQLGCFRIFRLTCIVGRFFPVVEIIHFTVPDRSFSGNGAKLLNLAVGGKERGERPRVVRVKRDAVQIVLRTQFDTAFHELEQFPVLVSGRADSEDRCMRSFFPDGFGGGCKVFQVEFRRHVEIRFVHDFIKDNPFARMFRDCSDVAFPDLLRRNVYNVPRCASFRRCFADQFRLKPCRTQRKSGLVEVFEHASENRHDKNSVPARRVDGKIKIGKIELAFLRFKYRPVDGEHAAVPVAQNAAAHLLKLFITGVKSFAIAKCKALRISMLFVCKCAVDSNHKLIRRIGELLALIFADDGEETAQTRNLPAVPADFRMEGTEMFQRNLKFPNGCSRFELQRKFRPVELHVQKRIADAEIQNSGSVLVRAVVQTDFDFCGFLFSERKEGFVDRDCSADISESIACIQTER